MWCYKVIMTHWFHFPYLVHSNSHIKWDACSVANSDLTLCDPINCSTPGFPVLWSVLKFMSIESVMPSNHLILCRPLLLLPSIFPSIRIFSNESVLCIMWPKYWTKKKGQLNFGSSGECGHMPEAFRKSIPLNTDSQNALDNHQSPRDRLREVIQFLVLCKADKIPRLGSKWPKLKYEVATWKLICRYRPPGIHRFYC